MNTQHTQQMAKKNYTKEQEAIIIATLDLTAADDVRRAQVKQLSADMNKTVRSIIAKAATLDHWKTYAETKPSVKRGAARIELVRELESCLSLTKDSLASIGRSNRAELVSLLDKVKTITTAQESASE